MEPAIATSTNGARLQLTPEEFARHIYIVGKSGSGKSTLLRNLALTLILRGEPVIVIDPHGPLAADLIDIIPRERTNHTIYLDLSDQEYAVGFNPLAQQDNKALAAASLVSALKSIFYESWGPRLEWFAYCGIALLLEQPMATLNDLPRLYYDEAFRDKKIVNVQDPKIKEFWTQEFPSYNDRYKEDAMGPILNKVGQFLASPRVRATICQHHPKLDLSDVIEQKGILIANLAKGSIGQEPAHLLGSLLVSAIHTTALARKIDTPFYVIIDEFQSFGTAVFSQILSEARKYGLSLTIAHQFTQQLTEYTRAAVLGNAGTLIVFQVAPEDAALLAPQFHLEHQRFNSQVLTNQPPFQAWIKRAVHMAQAPIDLAPPHAVSGGRTRTVTASSRRRFARPV